MQERSTEFSQKLAEFKKNIDQAIKNPLPISEHKEQLLKQALRDNPGYVRCSTSNDLRELLILTKLAGFFSVTLEFIDFQVKHEADHIEAAKKIYGPDVPHSYGIQFLQMENGSPAFVAMYEVIPPANISSEDFWENSQAIVKAPKHLSEGDQNFLKNELKKPSQKHFGE